MVEKDKNRAQAIGHIASGLFIICGEDENKKIDGFLASWVQQLSFTPPLIAFAIKPGRPAYDVITQGQLFSVNIVGEHEKGYLRYFWKGYDPQNSPFEEAVEYDRGENEGIIMRNAKSALECRLKEIIKPGDHELVVAEVLASYTLNENGRPTVHVRKSGSDY